MAKLYSFLIPASPTAATLFSASLASVTSTADITVGSKVLIGVNAGGTNGANAPLNIRFGNATRIQNAAVTDWFIPGGTTQYFEMGSEFDRVRIFNPGAGAVNYYVYVFSTT